MSNIPKDKILYDKIKANIYNKISKHSAYRSGLIVKEYKKQYLKKYKNSDAYYGVKKEKKGLARWYAENWKNQRGEVGYQKKGDVYRPTKRVTKDTPKTFKELNSKQIKKAMKEKKEKGRVKNFTHLDI